MPLLLALMGVVAVAIYLDHHDPPSPPFVEAL